MPSRAQASRTSRSHPNCAKQRFCTNDGRTFANAQSVSTCSAVTLLMPIIFTGSPARSPAQRALWCAPLSTRCRTEKVGRTARNGCPPPSSLEDVARCELDLTLGVQARSGDLAEIGIANHVAGEVVLRPVED